METKTTTKQASATTGAASYHFSFGHISEIFDHIEKHAETAPGNKSAYNAGQTNTSKAHAKWYGGMLNLTEYKETLKTGYIPAAQQLTTIATTSQGEALRPDVSGEFFDVGAYLLGHPECMADFAPTEAKRIQKIVIEASTPGTTNAAGIMKNAAAVYNSVQALENSGIRCEIFINVGAKKNGITYTLQFNAKKAEEPLLPTWHGLLFGHLSTVRLVSYCLLSLYSPAVSIGSPYTQTPDPDAITIDYQTDNPKQIIEKILNK